MNANTLILSGLGTNCEKETLYACRAAGATAVEVRHINAIYREGIDLDAFHFFVLIGGFLDGDDLGAARACANRFRYRQLAGGGVFLHQLERFVAQGRLVLGICNGFQLLVKLGLLPESGPGRLRQQVTLAPNSRGRFENRWVHLAAEPRSPCVFTRGLAGIDLPVRHGEGRLVGETPGLLGELLEKNLVPLRYALADGTPTEAYPENPAGSAFGVASLCNPAGTVMGLMPHPEAYNHFTNHPQWARRTATGEQGEGLALFRNAYRHLASNGA